MCAPSKIRGLPAFCVTDEMPASHLRIGRTKAVDRSSTQDVTKTPAGRNPLVSMRQIAKSFPGVLANDHVDLDVHGGEVHALLGENGAGKSTLVKILYGFYRMDSGEILIDGQAVRIDSPLEARRRGIGMVFQEFTLIPALSVLENIALFLPRLGTVLDKVAIGQRMAEVSQRYGLYVEPGLPVWRLSIGEQQKVEVLKLLLADAQILIFDEPTRVLAPHEIKGLFQVFSKLRADGYAVVFITHKLREVLACADRITVMSHGKVVSTLPGSEATESGLLSLMFGGRPPKTRDRRHGPSGREGQPFLELRDVSTGSYGGGVSLAGLNLQVFPGEIVGVAGVSGNGQKELGDVILGLEPCSLGRKFLFGNEATRWSVAAVRGRGVAFIPEDPLNMAAVPAMSVLENMALGDTGKYSRQGGFSMDWAAVRQDLEQSMADLGMTVPPLGAPIVSLSGGTRQRVSLVRELARNPRLIVALYPTRGLGAASAAAVQDLLLGARDSGVGVLFISEDLGELFSLSDRLVVLSRGRIVGEFRPQETSKAEVGYLMTGGKV